MSQKRPRYRKRDQQKAPTNCTVVKRNSTMGWLRSVGLIKLQVSFAEFCLFYRALLHTRPIVLSILLTEAIPYPESHHLVSMRAHSLSVSPTHTNTHTRTHTHTYACTHARTHTPPPPTHTCTYTHTQRVKTLPTPSPVHLNRDDFELMTEHGVLCNDEGEFRHVQFQVYLCLCMQT